MPVATAFWLLTIAFGQVWLPFRMNERGLPVLVRWAMYGAMIAWAALFVYVVWPSAFDAVGSLLNGYASTAPAPPADGRSPLEAWAMLAAPGVLAVATLIAVRRTYLDLTCDAGIRLTRPPANWYGKAS